MISLLVLVALAWIVGTVGLPIEGVTVGVGWAVVYELYLLRVEMRDRRREGEALIHEQNIRDAALGRAPTVD